MLEREREYVYILLSRIFGILLKLDLHAISDLVKHKDLFGSTIHDGSYSVRQKKMPPLDHHTSRYGGVL